MQQRELGLNVGSSSVLLLASASVSLCHLMCKTR